MQILKDNTRKSGALFVQLESLDDLWVLYNIIKEGDRIKGKTTRRVVMREGDTGNRQSMVLKLEVKKVEFHEFTNTLRVLGQIIEGPKDLVSYGDHHTFNMEPGKRYRIYKDKWYKNDINRIRKNIKRQESPLVLCVAIESGLANLALISDYSLNPITEINKNIPGKRYGKQHYEKALQDFFKGIKTVIEENVERNNIKLVVLCGPGFTKEELLAYLKEKSNILDHNVAIRSISASSGELAGVYEVLRDGTIATQKSDYKFAKQAKYMSEFIEHLGKEDGLATYGLEQVKIASEMGAIKTVMVCDKLLRTSDEELHQKVEQILNNTENQGGEAHILTTNGPTGEQLESYSGVAAILRFRTEY